MVGNSKELILTSVVERFRLEVERKQDLDNKANNLAGFVGIILSLISGFGLTSLTSITIPTFETTWHYASKISPIILFGIDYALLFLSFSFVLKAIQIKKYKYVPNAFNLIGAFEDSNKNDVCKALYDEYAIAIKDNIIENNKEADDIRYSIYCLFAALILFSITVILFMFFGR